MHFSWQTWDTAYDIFLTGKASPLRGLEDNVLKCVICDLSWRYTDWQSRIISKSNLISMKLQQKQHGFNLFLIRPKFSHITHICSHNIQVRPNIGQFLKFISHVCDYAEGRFTILSKCSVQQPCVGLRGVRKGIRLLVYQWNLMVNCNWKKVISVCTL